MLLDKLERGQVLLGTSPVVEISLTLALEDAMRMTIDVDDDLLARAIAFTEIEDRAAVIQHALGASGTHRKWTAAECSWWK